MSRIYVKEPQHFYTYDLPVVPGAEVYIGSAPNCHLSLPGVPGLAEMHACITCQGQEYLISDLGSPGGTFANGSPVRSVFLMPGVEYRMGAVIIMLAVEGAPPPPQMAPAAPPVQQPWGMQQGFGAPVQQPFYNAQPPYGAPPMQQMPPQPQLQPQDAAPKPPKTKMRRLNADELDELKSRFYNPRKEGFPVSKIFFFILVLLAIAFFANMLPVHREDALNFFRNLSRDMEVPAK